MKERERERERERRRRRRKEGTPCTVVGGSDCLLTREKVWSLSDVFSALRLEMCWLASYYMRGRGEFLVRLLC